MEATERLECFGGVNGLRPGVTTLREMVRRLGEPGSDATTPQDRVAGVSIGGARVVGYPELGIYAVLEPEDARDPDATLSAVYVEAPFAGRSREGLHVGQRADWARAILGEHFLVDIDLDAAAYYARPGEDEARLQVWFVDGKVERIKIFAP